MLNAEETKYLKELLSMQKGLCLMTNLPEQAKLVESIEGKLFQKKQSQGD